MAQITYDYHALKDARRKAAATVEQLDSQVKVLEEAAETLVSTNNAKGIQQAIDSLKLKIESVRKIITENEEVLDKALANTRELHVQNGGEE